jgi:hypothetical protein
MFLSVLRIRTIFDWIRILLLKRLDPDPVPNPEPDPDQNKLSADFLMLIFLMKIWFKKYIHGPKVKQQRHLKYTGTVLYMAFTHTKKVDVGSFVEARIRIRIRPNPDPQHWF